MTPRLAIVIVTYNSRRDLEGCLGGLTQHPPTTTHEIVMVDNGSGDGTPAFVAGRWPGVQVIASPENLGFSKANNRAIRATAGELVLLLNPDTIVPPGAIDRLVEALDADPSAAIAGPRLVDGDGVAELSFGAMIAPVAELRQKLLVKGNDRGLEVFRRIVERMTRREGHVDWVSGACLLARRRDIEAVGLLDERFFMYTEDVDLCAAVRARGRAVLFFPGAEVVHLRGRSAASAPRATSAAYRRSQIAFYRKHHPMWAPLVVVFLKITGRWPDTTTGP